MVMSGLGFGSSRLVSSDFAELPFFEPILRENCVKDLYDP